MASLHFRLVLGPQEWGEELVWALPPRARVLGGVQMRVLEGRLCKTRGEWSPGGFEGFWSWSDGWAGFLG